MRYKRILSGRLDIFYPSILAVFQGKGFFQHPQAITPTENCRRVLAPFELFTIGPGVQLKCALEIRKRNQGQRDRLSARLATNQKVAHGL